MNPLSYFIPSTSNKVLTQAYYQNSKSVLQLDSSPNARLLIERQLIDLKNLVDDHSFCKLFKSVLKHYIANNGLQKVKEEDLLLARLICIIDPIKINDPLSKILRLVGKLFYFKPKINLWKYFVRLTSYDLAPLPATFKVLINRLKFNNQLNHTNEKGQSTLMLAASHGSLVAVRLLIESGAKINYTNLKKQNALYCASKNGCVEVVEELINSGSAIGRAAIIAARYNHMKIVKLLIHAGANLYLVDNSGFSVFDIIKIRQDAQSKKIKQMILEIAPGIKRQSEQVILCKGVGHAWHLGGTTTLKSSTHGRLIVVEMEGCWSQFWLKIMAKDLALLPSHYPGLLSRNQAAMLKDAMLSGMQGNAKPSNILRRIQNHLPTSIEIGYITHSVLLFIWKKRLAICNRGACSTQPLEIFHFSVEKMTKKTLKILINLKTKADFKILIKDYLPKELDLRKTKMDCFMEKFSKLPAQSVGNCSWVSTITAVYAFFLFSIDIASKVRKGRVDKIKFQLSIYKNWLAFEQLNFLERLIKSNEDNQEYAPNRKLAKQSLFKAHSVVLDHINSKRLAHLTERYLHGLEACEREEFKKTLKQIPKKKNANL